MNPLTILLLTTPAVLAPRPGPAGANGDWPQWRGPDRSGVSTEADWAPAGEELWRTNVGLGYSSVTVHGGRLYTAGHDREAGLDVVRCLEAETGKEVWAHAYPAAIWDRMHSGGTLATPSVDGDVVYTLNREGRFHRFDAKTGEVQWERDLTEELGLEPPTWGFAASPLVLDDVLILNLGAAVALDKTTGKVRWRSDDYGHAYSTPSDFVLRGEPVLAVFNSEGLAVVDRGTGKQRYFHAWKTQFDINAASPVVAGERVFISSGLNRGCALVALGEKDASVVWESKVMRNKMAGCVLYGDHLYGFDEAAFKCIGLDGEETWRERDLGDGAFLLAGDKLILVSSKGELVVAEAKPAAFRELSRAEVLAGGVYWTPPVLVDGLIYVRNSEGDLVCRDHRRPASDR